MISQHDDSLKTENIFDESENEIDFFYQIHKYLAYQVSSFVDQKTSHEQNIKKMIAEIIC